MVNQCTTSEVSISTHWEDIKGDAKYRKQGSLGLLKALVSDGKRNSKLIKFHTINICQICLKLKYTIHCINCTIKTKRCGNTEEPHDALVIKNLATTNTKRPISINSQSTNDLQLHPRSKQLLLLDSPYVTSC